ncbi:hypothetical protein [Streptomyces sp. NPDC002553]|uniref:hypothetical protein n=1 Tax=Streptomyces sp. NPDC002553 TaxID=3154417 RepID=UPI003333DA20
MRKGSVKGGWSGVWEPSTALAPGQRGCFLDIDSVRRPTARVRSPDPHPRPQELAMADLAFVVTTIALFALVALVAKGVTKL